MNVKIKYKDHILIGNVLVREKYHLKVQLIYPLIYCPVELFVGGMCRSKTSFLSNIGDCKISELLERSFRKARTINRNLERMSKEHQDLKSDLESLELITNSSQRNRIKIKIEDGFFKFLFTPFSTHLYLSIDERKYILKFFDDYQKFKIDYNNLI
jgi:hypothetical protein